jgi:hypothetical protein
VTEKELLQIGKNNRRMAQLKEKYRELKYDNGIGSRTQDGMPHAEHVQYFHEFGRGNV